MSSSISSSGAAWRTGKARSLVGRPLSEDLDGRPSGRRFDAAADRPVDGCPPRTAACAPLESPGASARLAPPATSAPRRIDFSPVGAAPRAFEAARALARSGAFRKSPLDRLPEPLRDPEEVGCGRRFGDPKEPVPTRSPPEREPRPRPSVSVARLGVPTEALRCDASSPVPNDVPRPGRPPRDTGEPSGKRGPRGVVAPPGRCRLRAALRPVAVTWLDAGATTRPAGRRCLPEDDVSWGASPLASCLGPGREPVPGLGAPVFGSGRTVCAARCRPASTLSGALRPSRRRAESDGVLRARGVEPARGPVPEVAEARPAAPRPGFAASAGPRRRVPSPVIEVHPVLLPARTPELR